MQQHFVSPKSKKAWLFHRGEWFTINNPLSGEELLFFLASGARRQTLRRFFCGYELTEWTLGPTFLQHDYSGILVYVFVHEENRKATYMFLVNTDGITGIVFAQDLPDMLELLRMFAPLVEIGILVDIYRRGFDAFSRD